MLTNNQRKVLTYLEQNGWTMSTAIASIIQRPTSQVWSLLYRLLRKHLVVKRLVRKRMPGPYGKSRMGVITEVSITDAGRDRLRQDSQDSSATKQPPAKKHRRRTTIPRAEEPLLMGATPYSDATAPCASIPVRRPDCPKERPCPHIRCRYHLLLDVVHCHGTVKPKIKLNWPSLDLDAMPDTCALDVADREGASCAYVSQLLNLSKQRISQIEMEAFNKLKRALGADYHGPYGNRKPSSLAQAQDMADEWDWNDSGK